MKRTLFALAIMAVAVSSQAECFSRSAMTNQVQAKIERITDQKRTVVPTTEGQMRCTVSFRALIKGEWFDGEGVSQASPHVGTEQICTQAMNSGSTFLLQSIGGSRTAVEQEMVCTDEPKPRIRPVRIGQNIAESEVRPHPKYAKEFVYNGTTCRWFRETEARKLDIIQWQGVICKLKSGQWKVVDKF